MTNRAWARVARAMATAMRVAGKEEGKGSKGNGNKEESGRQAATTATKRVIAMAMRVGGERW